MITNEPTTKLKGCPFCRQLVAVDAALIYDVTAWALHQCPRPDPAVVAAHEAKHRERFTCPRCGDHRDTTITGHCDDCEA